MVRSQQSDVRFLPLKPYDIYAVSGGVFFAMELKLKTRIGGFPFKDLKENQLNNLMEVTGSGGVACVVINYRAIVNQRQSKRYNIKAC